MAKFWGLRGKRLGAAVWALAMFALMSFGYNQAVAGGVLTSESFNRQFPEMDTINTTGKTQDYNSTIQGTVIALYTLCGTFGALACTAFGDIIGRRKTIFLSSLVQIVGEILMGTSVSFAQFIVSRIVVGLGTGGILATISVWQSELAKAESRGEHVTAFGIFGGAGLSLALWVDFGASYVSSSFCWRFPFLFPIVLSAIVAAFIFTLPESPRWLVKMGRVDEARQIYHLRHETDDHADEVEAEIRDIQASLEFAGSFSLAAMFSMGPDRTFHRMILAILTQIMLQMSGVNVIAYYAGFIYEVDLGFSPTIAKILAASSMLVIVLGSLVCSWTVDRFGRRKLMLISASGMTVCMTCLAGLTSMSHNRAATDAAVFFLFAYYFIYCIGFLGIPFLYATELAPVHLRAAICGVSTAASWLFNFLVAEVTPIAFTQIHWRYFIVYAVLNLSWIPIVYYLFPETNGRTLEEIDEIFVESRNIFDPVKIARKLHRRRMADFVHDRKATTTDAEDPLPRSNILYEEKPRVEQMEM